MHFKSHELFISEIFHLMFSNHEWLQVTETTESKPTDAGVESVLRL
jgi:hypothetical protein